VLPFSLIKRVRGAQNSPIKERITICLSHDVVHWFNATVHG
jgi:uncharacterized protein (DUF4415 family)